MRRMKQNSNRRSQTMQWRHAIGMLAFMVAATACAEPIVYQGQLFYNSMPAAGQFDLECKLFDAVVDGKQIAPTVFVEDHVIPAGLLNVELDFGNVYKAHDMYLEISIRLGDSEDAYDTLAPRQLLTATPKAAHATTADSLVGPGWTHTPIEEMDGTISFGQADGRVFINAAAAIDPVEYLGVHLTDVEGGGVLVDNKDAMGESTYAYANSGVLKASHSFDGETSTWKLVVNTTTVLSANSSGVSALSYKYITPVTQSVTVAGDVFHSAQGTPFNASFFSGGAYLTTPGANTPMIAPIALPNGATITKVIGRFEDNATGNLNLSLLGAAADGTILSIGEVESTGAMVGIRSLESTMIKNGTVDSGSVGYYIRAFCPSWPGNNTLRIWSFTVQYTVPGPN